MIHLNLPKLIIASLVLLFWSMSAVFACDCKPGGLQYNVDQSNAVFAGKVIGFEYRKDILNPSAEVAAEMTGEQIEYETLVIKFEVDQWWKGEPKMEVSILTNTTRKPDGTLRRTSCDYIFKEGEQYLVFATGKENELRARGDCGGNKLLKEAEIELKKLGEGRKLTNSEDNPNKLLTVSAK